VGNELDHSFDAPPDVAETGVPAPILGLILAKWRHQYDSSPGILIVPPAVKVLDGEWLPAFLIAGEWLTRASGDSVDAHRYFGQIDEDRAIVPLCDEDGRPFGVTLLNEVLTATRAQRLRTALRGLRELHGMSTSEGISALLHLALEWTETTRLLLGGGASLLDEIRSGGATEGSDDGSEWHVQFDNSPPRFTLDEVLRHWDRRNILRVLLPEREDRDTTSSRQMLSHSFVPAQWIHPRFAGAQPNFHNGDPLRMLIPVDARYVAVASTAAELAAAAREVGTFLNFDVMPTPVEPTTNTFHRKGTAWDVVFGGHHFPLTNRLGVRYIAYLLQSSGRRLDMLELWSAEHGDGVGLPQLNDVESPSFERALEKTDPQTIAEVKDALPDFDQAIQKARERGDIERAEELAEEAEQLRDYLRKNVGLGDRPRSNGGEYDKKRESVWIAIKRAIEAIKDPELRMHLDQHMRRSGSYAEYTGDIRWNVRLS
jgi:hypothetical protein